MKKYGILVLVVLMLLMAACGEKDNEVLTNEDVEIADVEVDETSSVESEEPVEAVEEEVIDTPAVADLELGNSNSNYRRIYFEDYIYYIDGLGISRVKHDGSGKEVMLQGEFNSIAVYDDWIYFTDAQEYAQLKRVKIDGTGVELNHDGLTKHMKIANDKLYFQSMNSSFQVNIFECNLDGSDKKVVAESVFEGANNFIIVDDMLYYVLLKMENDMGSFDLCSKSLYDSLAKVLVKDIKFVTMGDGYMYYSKDKIFTEMTYSGEVLRTLDNVPQNSRNMLYYNQKLYASQDENMYVYDLKSNEIEWMLDGTGGRISAIAGDWLCYTKYDQYKIGDFAFNLKTGEEIQFN